MSGLSDFLTQGSAPWWSTLASGLGGAAIALYSTRLSDKRRLAREDRRQWDKELRELAGEVLDVATQGLNIRYERMPGMADNVFQVREGDREAEAIVEAKVKDLRAKLTFLASDPVLVAVDNLQASVWAIASGPDQYTGDPEERKLVAARNRKWNEAREEFIESVRKALRID